MSTIERAMAQRDKDERIKELEATVKLWQDLYTEAAAAVMEYQGLNDQLIAQLDKANQLVANVLAEKRRRPINRLLNWFNI